MTSFSTQKPQQTKPKSLKTLKTLQKTPQNQKQKLTQRNRKSFKSHQNTHQSNPNHTLQAHKCSNQPQPPKNSTPSNDFSSLIPRLLGFQRLRIRDEKREKERLSLAIFDAFVQKREREVLSLSLSTDLSEISPTTYLICHPTYRVWIYVLIIAWVIRHCEREAVVVAESKPHIQI